MCISWCLLNISYLKMHGKYNVKFNIRRVYSNVGHFLPPLCTPHFALDSTFGKLVCVPTFRRNVVPLSSRAVSLDPYI